MGERKSFRIHGLSSAVDGLNRMFFQETFEAEPDLVKLRSVLQREGSSLVRALNMANIQPGNLPTRSMRAAAWILFMQDEGHFASHIKALQMSSHLLREAGIRGFTLEFSYSSYLFRYKPMTKDVQISIHEGFANAPREILQAIAKVGVGGRGKSKAREQVMTYTKSTAFRSLKLALEQFSRAVYVEADARGQAFHLKTAFERINWAYFEGKQSVPHLCWSGTVNYRKLGHYNPISDTIQVSSLLDRKDTPEHVLDFIVYHELLHRDLGILEQNQRQMAHRSEFRHQEQDFAQYEAAQQYLRNLVSQR